MSSPSAPPPPPNCLFFFISAILAFLQLPFRAAWSSGCLLCCSLGFLVCSASRPVRSPWAATCSHPSPMKLQHPWQENLSYSRNAQTSSPTCTTRLLPPSAPMTFAMFLFLLRCGPLQGSCCLHEIFSRSCEEITCYLKKKAMYSQQLPFEGPVWAHLVSIRSTKTAEVSWVLRAGNQKDRDDEICDRGGGGVEPPLQS